MPSMNRQMIEAEAMARRMGTDVRTLLERRVRERRLEKLAYADEYERRMGDRRD